MSYPIIRSTRAGLKWQSNTPPDIEIRVKSPFISPEGEPINASDGPCFHRAACTLDGDGFVVTPDISVLPPTDGTDGRYTAHLSYQSVEAPGATGSFQFSVFGDGFPLPASPSETTWSRIAESIGRGIALPPSDSTIPFIFRDLYSSGVNNAGRRPTTSRVNSVWTPGAGNFTIAAGKLTAPIAFAQGDYQTIETNHSDVTLYSVLTGYDGGSGATKAMPGLIVRFVDANNYWLAQLDSFTGIVTLYEKTGGVFSARGATPPGAASGLALPLSLTAVGNKIIMELGGQAPVYYTSSQHMTATKVGVRVGGDGTTEGLPTYEEFTVMTAFVRSVDNPLIAPLAASWRSVDVAAAVRLYDPVRAKHVMTVSGFNGTIWQSGQFYLDSPEGPAVEEPSNPTRTPDTGTEGYIAASDGVAIKDGVYYKVLQVAPGVTAGHPGDGPWRLKFEKSMDQGLTWTPLYGGAMLPLGASGAFDDAGQHDPYLRLLSNGWFEISFAGEHDDAFSIGRCFTQDFVTFGPTAQLGILGRFGAGANIAGVCMAGDDPVRFAAYYCVTLPGALRHLCMSFTEDGGASWHYLGGVLYPDADVDGEGVQVFDQDVVIVNGKEYIYYAAADAAGAVEGFLSVLSVATRDIP